jgi:hypothetical protein
VPPVTAWTNGTFSIWSEVTMPCAVIWPPGRVVELKHWTESFGIWIRTTVQEMSLVPTRLPYR